MDWFKSLQLPPEDWSLASLWATATLEIVPLILLLSTISYGVGYTFGQVHSAVPSVSHPNFLPTPSLLAASEVRNRDSLDIVQSLFSSN